ncbi:MAG: hypothetical protein WCK90_00340, partial [archaeon]
YYKLRQHVKTMVKNYVSISGVSNENELREINRIYIKECLHYTLAIGYQVSSKSIREGTRNPRQPWFSDLGSLCRLTENLGFIPAIHYYGKDESLIVTDMKNMAGSGVEPSRALVQFNTLPPSVDTLREVKKIGFGIILKVAVADKSVGGYKVWKGPEVEDIRTGSVDNLIKQVVDRKDVIDYAMFDGSHGTGLPLDLSPGSLATRFMEEFTKRKELSGLKFVGAGGIGPDNVAEQYMIMQEKTGNRASVDIEGKARVDNVLSMKLVRAYMVCADYGRVLAARH